MASNQYMDDTKMQFYLVWINSKQISTAKTDHLKGYTYI